MELKLELEHIESASFSASRDTIHNTGYMGHEKRIKHRRVTSERREIICFDIKQSDRRSNKDRRNKTQNWKYSL